MSSTTTHERQAARAAMRLLLAGRVQGIGLRPAVARWARRLHLGGCVGNSLRGVEIIVEGPTDAVDCFVAGLHDHVPAQTRIDRVDQTAIEPAGRDAFEIVTEVADAALSARVPVDVVVCADCLRDVTSPANRRFGYALASCAQCGPRYSIIDRMPYERDDTAMAAFDMCPACRSEYRTLDDRRFHAQTNACPVCGPRLWCRDRHARVLARDRHAIVAAAGALRAGRVVALRGLGGYQLAVDASSAAAVVRLRTRKRRIGKPLAVMVDSLDTARRLAYVDADEARALADPAGPIVVVRRRGEARLASQIAPQLATVGLMLPTTPLHALLVGAARVPLVITSGNVEGEPLAYDTRSAAAQLADVADLWIEHDRPIRRPLDDSVVRVMAGRQVSIRVGRGLAPLPLDVMAHEGHEAADVFGQSSRAAVAFGGHQKAAIALTNGQQAILGPHIGDLDGVAARERFGQQFHAIGALYGMQPALVACDLHPDYYTTSLAANSGTPMIAVQHHHAHVAAGMLEQGWLDRPVLGVAFDGTGYGPDGVIWGGEFLTSTLSDYDRLAHLRTFRLPGGERAIREPWRVAAALVAQVAGPAVAAQLAWPDVPPRIVARLPDVLLRDRVSPLTTSAGRLFDGVAALVVDIAHAQFEGQPAMILEDACDTDAIGAYDIPLRPGTPAEIDWRGAVRCIVADRRNGVPPGTIAMRFHRGLATAIAATCRLRRELPVVLGGGVFQNRVLLELVAHECQRRGMTVGLPGRIPPNDGGLAAGQLAIALASARGNQHESRGATACV